MTRWESLKASIDSEVDRTILEPVQDVVDVFKYRISKGGAGIPNDNQIFTTWFFGGADVSYLADWCYFLYEFAHDEEYTVEQLVKMTRYWLIQPSEFGNYCGLRKQWEFVAELDAILDSLNKEQFAALMDSLRRYMMNINVWVYHFTPWGLGFAFPRKDQDHYRHACELLAK